MKCPKCGLLNPETAQTCDCGFSYAENRISESKERPTGTPTIRWFYVIGLGILIILNVSASYLEGKYKGFIGAELVGYSCGTTLVVLIVIGVSQILKRFRFKMSVLKIANVTLLITLVIIVVNWKEDQNREITLFQPTNEGIISIDKQAALTVSHTIYEGIIGVQSHTLANLLDSGQFLKKIGGKINITSKRERDFAIGASKNFAKGEIFEQIKWVIEQGGKFSFVKLYMKTGQSVLQFRIDEPSGMLRYIDFYLFKTRDGVVKINDFQNYESGPAMSQQIVQMAKRPVDPEYNKKMEIVLQAMKIAQEGRQSEAYALIESLPVQFKKLEPVMSIRIRLGMFVNAKQALELLAEFKRRFPGNPNAVFYAYAGCIALNNLACASDTVGDIYTEVGGDAYLLWFKANLLAEQKRYDEAVRSLSILTEEFQIDVVSQEKDMLGEDLIYSKEYRSWISRNRLKIE